MAATASQQHILHWAYQGQRYISAIVGTCPKCQVRALIRLPRDIRAQQPDGTTYVCHPLVGGCNQGYQ